VNSTFFPAVLNAICVGHGHPLLETAIARLAWVLRPRELNDSGGLIESNRPVSVPNLALTIRYAKSPCLPFAKLLSRKMKLLLIEVLSFEDHDQDTVNMASIDKQASRIARASFAVTPIIPPFPRGLIRNQNQALSRLHITKSTPKWRLQSDEPALTLDSCTLPSPRPPKRGSLSSAFGAPI
jgi:hypothetical protein